MRIFFGVREGARSKTMYEQDGQVRRTGFLGCIKSAELQLNEAIYLFDSDEVDQATTALELAGVYINTAVEIMRAGAKLSKVQ